MSTSVLCTERIMVAVIGSRGRIVLFRFSDDGTYCQYPTDSPIKAGSGVKITAVQNDEPVVETLNNLIEDGDAIPGNPCGISTWFDQVPMSPSYLIEISADASDSSAYTDDILVSLNFWTNEFERSIGPDGTPIWEPTATTAMRPGGSFQTEPEGDQPNRVMASWVKWSLESVA